MQSESFYEALMNKGSKIPSVTMIWKDSDRSEVKMNKTETEAAVHQSRMTAPKPSAYVYLYRVDDYLTYYRDYMDLIASPYWKDLDKAEQSRALEDFLVYCYTEGFYLGDVVETENDLKRGEVLYHILVESNQLFIDPRDEATFAYPNFYRTEGRISVNVRDGVLTVWANMADLVMGYTVLKKGKD